MLEKIVLKSIQIDKALINIPNDLKELFSKFKINSLALGFSETDFKKIILLLSAFVFVYAMPEESINKIIKSIHSKTISIKHCIQK